MPIQIFDDQVRPIDAQKVVIKETKVEEVVQFEGTLSSVNAELDRAIVERDEAMAKYNANIERLTTIRDQIKGEVEKLPERKPLVAETPVEEPIEEVMP